MEWYQKFREATTFQEYLHAAIDAPRGTKICEDALRKALDLASTQKDIMSVYFQATQPIFKKEILWELAERFFLK